MKSGKVRVGLSSAVIFISIVFSAAAARGQAIPTPSYVFGQARFGGPSGSPSIASGDFNGDGIPDFALANGESNTVSVFIGKRDGTFAPPVEFATGIGPTLVVSGDFNNDGKFDLAVVFTNFDSCCGGVSILISNGNGTFSPHIDYGVGAVPVAIVAADFNKDGNIDLAMLDQGSNSRETGEVSLLAGRGDGTFQPQIVSAAGPRPQSMVFGDFDGDGHLDLLVDDFALQQRPGIPSGGGIALLRGNGDGTFQTPTVVYEGPADDGQIAGSLAVGDFNGDKILDVAVVSQFPMVFLAILTGNGNGTFGAENVYVNTAFTASSVAVGDFQGDGNLDLLLGGINGVSLVAGKGDGTFSLPVSYTGDASTSSLIGVDVNGDNKLDVAYADAGGLAVILGNGDDTLGTPPGNYAAGTNVSAMVFGDFNGDGKPDIAVLNTNFTSGTTISILLNSGNGTFAPRKVFAISGAVTQSAGSLVASDFNADGKLDLAVKDTLSNNVLVLLGNGDGSFQSPTAYPTGAGTGSLVVGDFNRDGKLDLAVTNPGDSTVSILLGNGDGTFQTQKVFATGPDPVGLVTGDLNKDGKLDLVVVNGGLINGQFANTASVLSGNGDGSFQAHVDYPLGSTPSAVAIGDFNQDGNLDLAVLDGAGVSILLGNGGTTFQPPVDYASRSGSIVTADFNGDGKLDLITGGGSLLLGRGDGTFQGSLNFNAPSASTFAVAADFNDDGATDFATAETAGNNISSVSVFLSSPVAAFHPSGLRFSAGNIGSTSAAQIVGLSNPGPLPLKDIAISTAGDFAETNSCGSELISEGHCSISVTFIPTAAGVRNGQLVIADDAPGQPQILPLFGTGTNSGPIAILSAADLVFGTQVIGSMSLPQTVTLNNTGNSALAINGITPHGDYTSSSTCGTSLAAGKNCVITVIFAPAAKDSRPGTLTILDNAPGNPHIVNLSGSGTYAALSATTLTFGNQAVGTRSGSKSVTLTNRGTSTLNISQIVASKTAGDFLVSNNCGATLAPGVSCAITVIFEPIAKGARSESIFILDDGGASPQKIALAGTGI